MITSNNLFKSKRRNLFNHLRYWGDRMFKAYKERNYRMIEYYEGVIWGTIDTMKTTGFISFNTYITLDNMLMDKRAQLRGEYIC